MKVRLFLMLAVLMAGTPGLWADNENAVENAAKNAEPSPPRTVTITISPETTYITEPLLPDGRVDYYGALNRQLSEGITSENNIFAGVFSLVLGEYEYAILRAIYEGEENNSHTRQLQIFREKYCQMLGFDTIPDLNSLQILSPPGQFEPAGIDPYQQLLKFYPKEEIDAKIEKRRGEEKEAYRKHHEEGKIDDKKLAEELANVDSEKFRNRECREMISYEFYYDAMEKIFSETESPLIADWMKTSTNLAEKLIDVSKRPQSYNPLVKYRDDETMYECVLPYVQAIRQVARYFEARGNWHFGRGEYDEAFECAFTSLRTGTTMRSNAGFVVEELVGIAMQGIGHYDIVNYLGHLENKKDTAWILARQKEYRAISEFVKNRRNPPFWMTGERYGMLSVIAATAENPDFIREFLSDGYDDREQEFVLFEKCYDPDYDYDWDKVLERINYYWEDKDDFMLLPDDMRKARAYERLDDRLQEKNRMIMNMEIAPETYPENLLADFFYSSFSPALSNYFYAATRIECTAQMTDVAFSLAAYRSEHGEYPETLDQLVPKYLDAVPISVYTDKPLRYLKRDNMVLLVNDETYKLDGSEEDVEKKIAEATKDVDTVFPQVRSFMLILRY